MSIKTEKLSSDAELIALVADALRSAAGRPLWSTQNLPGRDMAAALQLLTTMDLHLKTKRADAQHEHAFASVCEVRYGNMPTVRVCLCGEWRGP